MPDIRGWWSPASGTGSSRRPSTSPLRRRSGGTTANGHAPTGPDSLGVGYATDFLRLADAGGLGDNDPERLLLDHIDSGSSRPVSPAVKSANLSSGTSSLTRSEACTATRSGLAHVRRGRRRDARPVRERLVSKARVVRIDECTSRQFAGRLPRGLATRNRCSFMELG